MTATTTLTEQTKESLNDMISTDAQKIIAKSTAKVTGLSALPIPLIDIAGMTYVQMKMIEKLAALYGRETASSNLLLTSSLISALISKLVVECAEAIATTANLDKMISGTLIKATISGLLTTATGEIYLEHFKQGGEISNLSFENIGNYITQQVSSDKFSVDNLASSALNSITDKYL